jgi:hypothetical protein
MADEVDIWKKKSDTGKINKTNETSLDNKEKNAVRINNQKSILENNISSSELILKDDKPLFGIYDPEENDLNLNIWINSDGNTLKGLMSRIDKIKLSNFAEEIFVNTIMTYSYPPSLNLKEEEFLNLKIDWLIKNSKDEILEEFLKKNQQFKKKKNIIQYFVDKNIAKANLGEACKKSDFISKDIKDSYLEKFKIYCLIFNDKKTEAQLLFDILKEQDLSDIFFNNKINFLLGINTKPNKDVKTDNLLNFYLSSVTVPNFKYEPNEKTNKFIWKYLNSANLITIENFDDKEKIKTLEIAANDGTLDNERIFEIYKQRSFDLNTLINADIVYQSLDNVDARALVYQKYLLTDKIENKINQLATLKEMFKKDKLDNVFTVFMSNELKKINEDDIPDSYKQVVESNIISETEYKLGRIKYDDKILHRSRVLRFYTEKGTSIKKSQKDLINIYKKIKRNKDYFFSAKDLSLIEALQKDGFKIPKEIDLKEISERYFIPEGLNGLIKKQEIGHLALKFVEIIGEDEIQNLDSETIYFIINALNKANLIKFRNKALITALPLRS